MIASSYEWTKWAFDGVGGAAALGLVGWCWRHWHLKANSAPSLPFTTTTASDDANAVAIGAGANINGAPIVVGSHNTVNFISHAHAEPAPAPRDGLHKENATFEKLAIEMASKAVVTLSIMAAAGVFFYFAIRHSGEVTINRAADGITSADAYVVSTYVDSDNSFFIKHNGMQILAECVGKRTGKDAPQPNERACTELKTRIGQTVTMIEGEISAPPLRDVDLTYPISAAGNAVRIPGTNYSAEEFLRIKVKSKY
jgi:hypothetical protein